MADGLGTARYGKPGSFDELGHAVYIFQLVPLASIGETVPGCQASREREMPAISKPPGLPAMKGSC